jgi:hypothetical protein
MGDDNLPCIQGVLPVSKRARRRHFGRPRRPYFIVERTKRASANGGGVGSIKTNSINAHIHREDVNNAWQNLGSESGGQVRDAGREPRRSFKNQQLATQLLFSYAQTDSPATVVVDDLSEYFAGGAIPPRFAAKLVRVIHHDGRP